MRVQVIKFLVFAGAVAGVLLAPSVLAATEPTIYSVSEGRDATSSKPVVILSGKRLNRFKAFSLFELDGVTPAGTPLLVTRKPDLLVLSLPAALASGTYVLVATDSRGTDTSMTVQVGNGAPLPASVTGASLDPSLRADLDDAATLEGHPAAFFTNLVGAKVYLAANYDQDAGGHDQPVRFDTEEFDPQGSHTPAASTKLTCQVAGYYRVSGRLAFTTNPLRVPVKIRKNGTTVVSACIATLEYNDATPVAGETSTVLWLNVGDYVELYWPNGEAFWPPSVALEGGVGKTELSMYKVGD